MCERLPHAPGLLLHHGGEFINQISPELRHNGSLYIVRKPEWQIHGINISMTTTNHEIVAGTSQDEQEFPTNGTG